jgi:hypothetical protein
MTSKTISDLALFMIFFGSQKFGFVRCLHGWSALLDTIVLVRILDPLDLH